MRFAAKLVQIVEAIQRKLWLFVAITDNRTCTQCMRFDRLLMTEREIIDNFPYLERVSDLVWFPRVHPNCRCELYFDKAKIV